MAVPVVLSAVGVGTKDVADDAVRAPDLGVGVLAVGRPDDLARTQALDEGAEHIARELGVVVHYQNARICRE